MTRSTCSSRHTISWSMRLPARCATTRGHGSFDHHRERAADCPGPEHRLVTHRLAGTRSGVFAVRAETGLQGRKVPVAGPLDGPCGSKRSPRPGAVLDVRRKAALDLV